MKPLTTQEIEDLKAQIKELIIDKIGGQNKLITEGKTYIKI